MHYQRTALERVEYEPALRYVVSEIGKIVGRPVPGNALAAVGDWVLKRWPTNPPAVVDLGQIGVSELWSLADALGASVWPTGAELVSGLVLSKGVATFAPVIATPPEQAPPVKRPHDIPPERRNERDAEFCRLLAQEVERRKAPKGKRSDHMKNLERELSLSDSNLRKCARVGRGEASPRKARPDPLLAVLEGGGTSRKQAEPARRKICP